MSRQVPMAGSLVPSVQQNSSKCGPPVELQERPCLLKHIDTGGIGQLLADEAPPGQIAIHRVAGKPASHTGNRDPPVTPTGRRAEST